MIETREQLESPGAVRRAVAEIGVLAAGAGGEDAAADAVDRLRDLAAPAALDLLFRLALESALRRGPDGVAEAGTPGRILELAAAAAAAGALPIATVATLRATLHQIEEDLRSTGAWDRNVPFWWSPLPEPRELESGWRRMEAEGWLRLPASGPSAEEAREIAAGWSVRADALAPELVRRVAAELEALSAAGSLALRQAGVGRGDRRTVRRSDEVLYLTGLEPDLVERAPTVALTVQRLLETVGEELCASLPAGAAFAPQSAMLARYPAPSDGFAAHLDNPGGANDNGRTFALIVYLNPPGHPCRGGELTLWRPGESTEASPAAVLPAVGGSAVLLDARRVPHAVRPLAEGPDRWTLVLWLSDRPRRPPRPLLPVREPDAATVLRAVDRPPTAPGTVILRRLGEIPDGVPATPAAGAERPVIARTSGARRVRVGFVTTVRGPGPALDAWCRHHLALGAEQLLVVLDGESEARDEVGGGDERCTVWSAAEARRRRDALPAEEDLARLRPLADRGRATWAVAARQALNASAALEAAAAGDLGGAPLDWLVHLDADELFHPEGNGRGGGDLQAHFAAVGAEGWTAVRYLNHELLLPWAPGEPARFKRNPALAVARLGPVGWARLAAHLGFEQAGGRPYFRAYWNGKGAIAVAAGGWAAGVHGWRGPAAEAGEVLLAGPSILHYHLPTAAAFRGKYRAALEGGAEAEAAPERPFPPSRLESEAAAAIREVRARGGGEPELEAALDELYRETALFTPREVELLDAAGLLFTPRVEHPPLPASADREAGAPVPA